MSALVVRGGEQFAALRDVPVTALIHWRAPLTTGAGGILPAGTVIEVIDDPLPHATAVGCWPVDRASLERILVPPEDHEHPAYDGYHLVISFEDLARQFRRV